MYEVYLFIEKQIICTVLLSSISKVARFLDTVDFSLVHVDLYSPNGCSIDPVALMEIWHA